jgi:hypothetical protein
MLATAFISWWYGDGWKLVAANVSKRLDKTLASFSVPTLARTLFAPWKRIVSTPGSGIDAYFRAALDNFVSRCVGFTVRLIVLLTAVLCLAFIAIVGVLQIALWPLVPLLIVAFAIRGLI